jgi:hypothetical protein
MFAQNILSLPDSSSLFFSGVGARGVVFGIFFLGKSSSPFFFFLFLGVAFEDFFSEK